MSEWQPYLKHPYTKLRDLGFGPEIQSFPVDQANEMLANIALAAINAGQTIEESATDVKDLARRSRAKRHTERPPDP